MNKPFNFLKLDSRSETDITHLFYIGVNQNKFFTVKSLILAQDER